MGDRSGKKEFIRCAGQDDHDAPNVELWDRGDGREKMERDGTGKKGESRWKEVGQGWTGEVEEERW